MLGAHVSTAGGLARARGLRDGSAWTFEVLARPGRALAASALLGAALLGVLASAIALARARARRRAGAPWIAPATAVAWAPALPALATRIAWGWRAE